MRITLNTTMGIVMASLVLAPVNSSVLASSHMDAPLITLDPAANTTDVYAFVDEDNGTKAWLPWACIRSKSRALARTSIL